MINKVMPIFGKRAVSSGTLLLDLYPNAEVAYSLRYLRTAYIGSPVARVRRSSDNAELDFTPTEITDGTLTTWTGANDGRITTWYDQSLNSINAVNSTPAEQPLIVSAGLLQLENGLPTMVFNSLEYLEANVSLQPQPNTYFIVNKKTTAQRYLFDSTSATNRNTQGNSSWMFAGIVLSNVYPTIGSQVLITMLFNDPLSSGWFNGALQNTGITGSQGLLGLRIGAAWNLSFGRLIGNVQEFIMYPTDQTSNRIGIETDINNHFSIY